MCQRAHGTQKDPLEEEGEKRVAPWQEVSLIMNKV